MLGVLIEFPPAIRPLLSPRTAAEDPGDNSDDDQSGGWMGLFP